MWQKRPYDKEKEKKFIEMGKGKLISRLLSQRDIDPLASQSFLSADYKDLSHPHTLSGVKEAVDIFCKVALKKGKVSILTDYDCDGILSAVLLKELCNVFGLECMTFLPSRIEHGYGLSENAIKDFKERCKAIPDLLIIADCGSNNEKQIKELKEFGIKHIIILDHHIIDQNNISKSADVLINWHQSNSPETCACGEIFHFIRGIRWLTKKVNPIEFLSYASIAILADVSPIIGDNRIIVKNGLGSYALKHVTASGLNALLRKSWVYSDDVSQEDVLFKIAPRINAVGRLFKPDVAFGLLIEHDPDMAELMATNLNEYNDDRKKIQKIIEKEAIGIVKKDSSKYTHGIVLYNAEWPAGIVGIVASKVAEAFCKPALIIGKNGDVLKGSGRSVGNVNLKDILDLCSEMFDGYGGHAAAAGITLKPAYLDKANDLFNDACKRYYDLYGFPEDIQYYDIEVPPRFVTIKGAVLLLDTLYPYCQRFNPEPVFLLSQVRISDVQVSDWAVSFHASKNGEKTGLKMRLFNAEMGGEIEGTTADVYFTLPQSIQSGKSNYPPQANVVEFVPKK